MNNVGIKLKPESCFAIRSNGKSGGLAMSWAQDIKVDNTSFSSHRIDAEVEVKNEKYVRCTGVYGHPKEIQKKYTWTLLCWLAGFLPLYGFALVILMKYCTWKRKIKEMTKMLIGLIILER